MLYRIDISLTKEVWFVDSNDKDELIWSIRGYCLALLKFLNQYNYNDPEISGDFQKELEKVVDEYFTLTENPLLEHKSFVDMMASKLSQTFAAMEAREFLQQFEEQTFDDGSEDPQEMFRDLNEEIQSLAYKIKKKY